MSKPEIPTTKNTKLKIYLQTKQGEVITAIDVSCSKFNDNDAIVLASFVRHHLDLQCLELYGNDITAKGG